MKDVLVTIRLPFITNLVDLQWQKFGRCSWREDTIKTYPHQ